MLWIKVYWGSALEHVDYRYNDVRAQKRGDLSENARSDIFMPAEE